MIQKCYGMILLLLLLTGCWDKVEIEERGFIYGNGIDAAEKENEILLTQQIVIPAGLNQGAGQGGGGGQQKAYLNVTEAGETMFQIVREVAAKTSRTPFFGHMKLIIISEDIAKSKDFADLVDFYLRDHEMRRGILVLMANGKAHEVLSMTAPNEQLPVEYIRSISENTFKNAEIYPKTRIGDIQEYLLKRSSFALTMIEKKGEELELRNAAVIDGQTRRYVGSLNRKETMGANFITDEVKGGIIKIEIENEPKTYEIYRANTSVSAEVKSPENITFKIDVQSEGSLGETFLPHDLSKVENLTRTEEVVEKKIKEMVNQAVEKLQDDYGTDILKFGAHLRQNHYDTWEKIKDDWETGEKYFTKVNVEVDVKVILRSYGSVNQIREENKQ
jgi:spore germination protein